MINIPYLMLVEIGLITAHEREDDFETVANRYGYTVTHENSTEEVVAMVEKYTEEKKSRSCHVRP